jgi:BASS family bile acid:Na+ symporter
MAVILDLALKLSLIVFMAGSLLQTGLGMGLARASAGLRDPRFLAYGLVFGFVLGPLVAWAPTRLIPLAEPYAVGLLLLGLTPRAPFLPQMTARAKGDESFAPAMLLIAGVGTVILMPVAVPVLAPGLDVTPWTIAKPPLLVVLLPLVAGLALRRLAEARAEAMIPAVRKITAIATLVLLVLSVVIYGDGFTEAVGRHTILALALFFLIVTAFSYLDARGLPQSRRSVLGLGVCTRNAGAALAPLFSVASADERAIVMVVLGGVPMQIAAALIVARWFACEASRMSAASRQATEGRGT